MSVRLLSVRGTNLTYYPYEPEEVIVHAMTYENPTLIMEPGELADFAQGHKFITNSNAEIVILNDGESYIAPEGKYFHIFLPVKVGVSMVWEGKSFVSVRNISKAPSYRRDNT